MTEKGRYALTDFAFFIEHILGMKLWACQKRWADKIQTCIDGDYLGLQLLAPPDHGKTSRLEVPLILWLWARDRRNRIIFVRNTDVYAEQVGRAIMNRVERMPILREEYGIQRGTKWAASEMHIMRDSPEDDENPSLLCLGVGSDAQSQRADFIICDDLATRKNSKTENQRKVIESYFDSDLDSRLDKVPVSGKNKVIVLGHRVEANDFYEHNSGRESEGWLYHTDPAILDDSQRKILAPEYHSYEALSRKRARQLLEFELMYQQRSVAQGCLVTFSQMEACRRPDLKFVNTLTPDLRGEFKMTWLTLDPAFTTNRWSSHAVFALWGMKHNGSRRLLWGLRDKMVPDQLLAVMEMKHRIYNPDAFCIEVNQAQTLLVSHMRRKFPEQASKFKSVSTVNPDGRLEEEIGKMFELYAGDKPMIELPYAGPTEQAFVSAMTSEYTDYPNGRTRDTLMSQYVGEKGLGLIKNEERTARVLPRGIMGAVANQYRGRFRFRG